MKRHRVSDSAPPGASSRREVLCALETLLMGMPSSARECFLDKLQNGVMLLTDYSGTGQAEYALMRLALFAVDRGREPKVHAARASDISPACRRFLKGLCMDIPGLELPKTCVMGDLVSRQSLPFRNALITLTMDCRRRTSEPGPVDDSRRARFEAQAAEKARKKWLAGVKALIKRYPTNVDKASATCSAHGQSCRVFPHHECGWITLLIAGISCLDWSSRGLRGRTIGKGALAWASFMRELMSYLPDIAILECTRSYMHEDLVAVTDAAYDTFPLVFSPTDVGIPSQRVRKYMVLLHRRGHLRWKANCAIDGDRFMALFGRKMACDGNVYFADTPGEAVRAELRKWCERRHLPQKDADGRAFAFTDVLTRKQQVRFDEWIAFVKDRGADDSSNMIYDLAQHPQYGTLGSAIPALTRRNMPWSSCFGRPLIPLEKFEVQGIPVFSPAATLGLDAAWPYVLHNSSSGVVNTLTGNAMHLAAIGLVLGYTFAFTENNIVE